MKHIVIVGAGAAGLAAANEVQLQDPTAHVTVVEAGPSVGGRVRQERNVVDEPIELGPEFIHGEAHNLVVDLIEKGLKSNPNLKLKELEWPNYFYFNKEGRLVHGDDVEDDAEINRIHDVFTEMESIDPESVQECTVLQYLVQKGVSSRVLDLADAIYANDYGTDLHHMGLQQTIAETHAWRYGFKYLVLENGCLADLVSDMADGVNVKLNWQVCEVHYNSQQTPSKVHLVNQNREHIVADKVIVTTSIKQLQNNAIKFHPELPQAKRDAINRITMSTALKVVVVFKRAFWPKDFYDAVCADSFLPELWITPPASAQEAHSNGYAVVGFVTGPRAERVEQLPDNTIVRLFAAQLDAMFGTDEQPHPASSQIQKQLVYRWSEQPFVQGAYCAPALGAFKSRPKLAAPVDGCLFFAGEACHEGMNPCLQGAMETGVRAARQAVSSFQNDQDRQRESLKSNL